MANKVSLIALGFGLAVALLCAALLGAALQRQHAPPVSGVALATAPLPAQQDNPPVSADKSDAAEAGSAKNASDPEIVQFVSSFRTSAAASCRTSFMNAVKSTSSEVAQKAATVCDCATNSLVATITVDEAHSAIRGALLGNAATDPTLLALKSRFLDAGKQCLLKPASH